MSRTENVATQQAVRERILVRWRQCRPLWVANSLLVICHSSLNVYRRLSFVRADHFACRSIQKRDVLSCHQKDLLPIRAEDRLVMPVPT